MTDGIFQLMELSQAGFYCSQIILILGLETQEKENPDLVRAMSGLNGGIGFCGKTCGILTGGACLIGLFAGKGLPEELEDGNLNVMIKEFADWFEQEVSMYGGTDCNMILEQNPANRMMRCPQLILSSLEKLQEILAVNGYSFRL